MPLVELRTDTSVGKAGQTVKVNGATAQQLVRDGLAVVVREQRRERTSR